MGTGKLSGKPDEVPGRDEGGLALMDWHPIQGRVVIVILLVLSRFENWD